MKPTFVRFVLSSNKDVQFNIPPQSATHSQAPHPIIQGHNNFSSLQFLNRIPSTAAANQTRIVITSPPSTFNLSKEIITQKANNLTTVAPISKTAFDSSLSSVDISAIKSNNIPIIPVTDICKCISFKNSFIIYSQQLL